jgi:dihydroneopterin aldolase
MSDRILLRGLRFVGYHGVFATERERGQPFVVDLDLELPLASAGHADALELTVDYGAVALQVRAIVEGEPVQLIETLAERIAARVLASTPVERVRVRVDKPEAPLPVAFTSVAVEIVRERSPSR